MSQSTALTRGRIVLATFGSFGDLHPFLAIGTELKRRGHHVVIATSESYRNKVEKEALEFRAVPPDPAELSRDAEFGSEVVRGGAEFVIRRILMPHLRESYEALVEICRESDVLISHPLIFAAPLVSQKLGISWASVAISPLFFFSTYDPPVLAPAPWLQHLRPLGPPFFRFVMKKAKQMTSSWSEPVHQLTADLGLPPSRLDPMYEGQFSPELNLAVFASEFASPQPDWPPSTQITGFPLYDRHGELPDLNPALTEFLDNGDPPIVFTLGTAAAADAGSFFEESAKAARELGRRALLLVGPDPRNRPTELLSPEIAAFEYAPYSTVFPKAAAIVHPGGIGTIALALRAGKPMLIVPFSFDQPENARRTKKLGAGIIISRKDYQAESAARKLRALLSNPRYAHRALEIGARISEEDGAVNACLAIEALLEKSSLTRRVGVSQG